MDKSKLIDTISATANLSKADATHALNTMTATITTALADGDSVQLIGFGSFVVRERAACVGRNPQTGEIIQIAASKLAAFKSGKVLKNLINNK